MKSRFINRILGVIYLVNYVIYASIISVTLFVSPSFTDYYVGFNLISFFAKIVIYNLLCLFVIWALFFNRIKAIYVFVPLHLIGVLISKYWTIPFNSPKYQEMVASFHEAIKSGNVIHSNVKLFVYPLEYIYIFYILSILYVFLIMPRMRKKEVGIINAQIITPPDAAEPRR